LQLHKTDAQSGGMFSANVFDQSVHGSAQIGISVEPLSVIGERVPAFGTQPSNQVGGQAPDQ
jgi:hypothetical protein